MKDYKTEIVRMLDKLSGAPDGAQLLYKAYQLMRRFVKANSPADVEELSEDEVLRLDSHALLKEIPDSMMMDVHGFLMSVCMSSKEGGAHRVQ